MPFKDIGLEIYAAIANALQKDTDWVVDDVNFKRYDTVKGTEDPEDIISAEGDYPQAMLEGPVEGTFGLRTNDETFGTFSNDPNSPPPQHWSEHGQYSYRLTVKSDLLGVDQYSPLTSSSISAVRNAGARLGLPYVTKVSARFTSKEERSPDNDTKQIVTTIILTVEYDTDGHDL